MRTKCTSLSSQTFAIFSVGFHERVHAGRPVIGALVARTVFISQCWPIALAQIWKSVEGSLSSRVFQFRSYSDQGLDYHVPPCQEASSTAQLLGESPPGALTTLPFRAYRSVDNRHANPVRKYDGYRIKLPSAVLEFRGIPAAALSEAKRQVNNHDRSSRNVAQESIRSSRQGFVCRPELVPFGSARGRGNIQLASPTTAGRAVAALRNRQQQGLSIEFDALMDALKQCSQQKDLVATRQLHDCIIQSGMHKQRYVATSLLNAYIKCGRLSDAHRVFDGLQKSDRNVISWTAMIGAYSKSGSGMEAYRLFLEMKREGFEPNAITYMSILNIAAASAGALEWVRGVHSHALKAGLESNLRVGTALVHMYSKTGSIDDARLLFDRMEKRNVFTWNVIIGAYAESGSRVEAYRLFLEMKREGFEPDAITYMSVLNASASAGALEWVKEVHSHVLEAGLELDLRVGTALVHMYTKSGNINDARRLFDRMEKRNVVTWTVIIGGFAEHGFGQEALNLFGRMNEDCVEPDELTLVAVLSACSHAGLVDDGRRIFSAMKQDYGIEPDIVHYTCMVDILGRAGLLEEAKLLVENMPVEPNAVTWMALLGACRTHRNVDLGELAAEQVFKLEPTDSSAYVLLSNIYAATGKWEKVVSVRNMMQERGVRKKPGRSWIEVDNKIHEFVVGDTSHPEAKAIYIELEKLTERLKAKGYIPDTKLVLHNIDEVEKELVLCSHSEKLAIAYGLLRVRGREPVRVQKNLRVCLDCHAATKLISEVTGREIIVRDANRFHHFKDGVCSCGDYW